MDNHKLDSLRLALWEIAEVPFSNISEVKHLVQEVVERFLNSPVARALSQGVIIDAALSLNDQDATNKAIKYLKTFLNKQPRHILQPLASEISYYIATAFYGLHTMSNDSDTKWAQLIESNRWYQKAKFELNREVPIEIRTRILVNHGNTLAELNRWYEAIKQYHRALNFDPQHAMAQGNLALELSKYAWRMGREASSALALARSLMDEALSPNSGIDLIGAHDARQRFEATSQIINRQIEANKLATGPGEQNRRSSNYHVSTELSDLNLFIARNRLFLQYDVEQDGAIGSQSDTLFFNYYTPLDKTEKFAHLARVFNEMKEAFALSRYLLWLAMNTDIESDEYSSWTGYADTLEYADYGLKSSLTKSAFTTAYGILDKIAVLLHREFETTSHRERDIYFSNVFDAIKTLEDPDIDHLKSLQAIASMSRELHQSETRGWTNTRNRLTHRHLVPHGWMMMVGEGSTEDEHVDIDSLISETLDLLQFTKSAMLYLVDTLNERYVKTLRSEGHPITMPMFYMFQMGYVGEREIDEEQE